MSKRRPELPEVTKADLERDLARSERAMGRQYRELTTFMQQAFDVAQTLGVKPSYELQVPHSPMLAEALKLARALTCASDLVWEIGEQLQLANLATYRVRDLEVTFRAKDGTVMETTDVGNALLSLLSDAASSPDDVLAIGSIQVRAKPGTVPARAHRPR